MTAESSATTTATQAASDALISIVVPVYREARSLRRLSERVAEVMGGIADVRWELVFVNDGSPDDSLTVLKALAAEEPRCKVIDLSRNFGKEIALSAGLRYARGDAVICMDADLQHPPEVIPELIAHWRDGAELVATHRKSIRKHPLFRRLGSTAFYWVMARISETNFFSQSTDFSLVDRRVVEQFNQIEERDRSYRGLLDWMGLNRVWVEFVADEREAGAPGYSYAKLLNLAITNFILYSTLPLRAIIFFGLLVTFLSGALLGWMLLWYTVGSTVFVYTPLALVAVSNTFMIGILLMTLGVIALYVAKINQEVGRRPLYLVRSLINFADDDVSRP